LLLAIVVVINRDAVLQKIREDFIFMDKAAASEVSQLADRFGQRGLG